MSEADFNRLLASIHGACSDLQESNTAYMQREIEAAQARTAAMMAPTQNDRR